MSLPPTELLEAFIQHFEDGLARWEHAMQTGDTSQIEAGMGERITCYFGMAGQEQMEVIDRAGIIAGMRDSVTALQGCQKRFENRLVRMRSADEAVVFYEQIVERQGEVLARLFTIETYRCISGQWRCIREVTEHVGA